jgi:MFS family permease
MRRFRMLVAGNAISSYGTFLNMVALNLFAFHVTGSALRTGLFLALRLAASVATGMLAGGLASRHSRKVVMVASDLTQAAALITLLAAPATARPTLLYGLALVAGAGGTLSGVSLRTSVPELVGPQHRVRANGLLATGRSLAMVAGFASSGLVISLAGYTGAFLLDAGTFLISAAILARMPIPRAALTAPHPAADGGVDLAGATPGWAATQRTALRVLRTTPVLLIMITIRAVDGFGSASHNVSLPVYSTTVDPAHPAALIAQFWATWAIGNIVAQQLISRYVKRTGRTIGERAFGLGMCVMSLAFIAVFTGLSTPALVAVALVAGVADGFTENAYISRLQGVSDDRRGYVFGFSAMVENLGFGTGMLLSAALLERLTPLRVVATFHGTAIVLASAFLIVLILRGRRRAAPGATGAPALGAPGVPAPTDPVPAMAEAGVSGPASGRERR